MLQKTEAPASAGRQLLLDIQEHGGSLRQSELQDVDGRNIDFPPGTDFYVANMGGIDLTNSRLRQAILYGAHAPRSIWTRASVEGSDMRHLDLANSTLFEISARQVIARRVNFTNSDLRGADFTEADLGGAQLGNVVFDESTIWPDSIAEEMARILDESIEDEIRTPRRFTLDSDGRAPDGLFLT